MTKEAIIMAVIVQVLIAGVTCYLFYKVLTNDSKPDIENTDEESRNA